MGHLIRQNKRNPKDPMVQVTFEGKNIKPRTPAYRRVGRPKLQWTEETLAESWNRIRKKVEIGPSYDFKNTKNTSPR